MKKITTVLIAVIISISVVVPFVTQAQTTTASNTSLLAVLTQLVQLLEQELQQLIATQGSLPITSPTIDKTAQPNTRQSSIFFFASPMSGVVPLQVQFTINNYDGVANPIMDFGDGTSGPTLNFGIAASQNQDALGHTYNTAGTYIAKFEDSSGEVLATATITVTAATQPSATINQNSLTSTSANPVITGTASGMTQVAVDVSYLPSGAAGYTLAPVANGQWSVTLSPSSFPSLGGYVNGALPSGSYQVSVFPGNFTNLTPGNALATGTLTVQ